MARMLQNLFCRLLNFFQKPAVPTDSLFPFQQNRPAAIDFHGLKRGIDNVHVDVRLSQKFVTQVKRVTGSMLEQEIGRGGWGEKPTGPTRRAWEEFRTSYARMVETTIHRAKVEGGLALVQLVQIASMKFILRYVHTELDQLRQGLRGAMAAGGSATDSNRLELTERLSWLARNRAKLRYKLIRQLFGQLFKVEEGAVGELRHSLLGERWSIPEEVLSNPLLQAENPLDDEIMMKHYVVLGQGEDDLYSFSAIDSLLPYLFQRQESTNSKKAAAGKATQAECLQQAAWAEVPANVDILFNADLYKDALKTAKQQKDKESAAKLAAQIRFQRRLLAMVENKFRSSGLLPPVVAGYEMGPLYRDYASVLTAQQLHQYLAGTVKRKDILLTVKDKQQATGKALPLDLLLQAAQRVDRMSCSQQRARLVRFLKDFVTFRRDLANYHLAHQAMNQVQLQEDPQHVKLSRANRTLYEFLAKEEEGAVAQTILGHVILKADVRGSTTVVAELRNRGLNPASHFSLNFFTPLNELLELYGASKVFIEGDAVILSIVEHEEALEHQFSVARACGLAKRLLSMVQAQNAVCKKEGLPELELGIGLVFQEEPPMFLYDGNNQIMISSAIGKADRLSSCSWMLRKQRGQLPNNCTNVDIYEIPEGDPLRGEKGEVHLRYNLNGIELDAAAFAKLQSEITLQQLALLLPGDENPTTIFTGRYPDLKGTMQRVVVREGQMRLFDKHHPKFGKPTASVFYEVVVNEWVLDKVHEALKGADAGEVV